MSTSAQTARSSRSTVPGGIAAAVGGFAFVLLGLFPGPPPELLRFSVWMAVATVAIVLLAAAVVGLARSGLAGQRWPARAGVGVAVLGLAVFALAHGIAAVDPAQSDGPLFPIGGNLGGLGMLAVGVVVLRARRWPGAGRWTPLVCGLYPFVVLIPAFVLFGEPNFPAIAGFGATWLLLGIALTRVGSGVPALG